MAVHVRVRVRQTAIHRVRFARLAERLLVLAGEPGSDFSVDLIGDRRMRRLNRVYRKQDRPTDVLAFAMREAKGLRTHLLGDVVISVPTARRQACQAGRSLDQELAVLLIHGLLHLCGYDHERGEQEARHMQRKERAMLRAISPLSQLVSRPRRGTRIGPHG